MSRIYEALLKIKEREAMAPSGAEAELSMPAVVEADNAGENLRRGPRFEPFLTSELGAPPISTAPGLTCAQRSIAQL